MLEAGICLGFDEVLSDAGEEVGLPFVAVVTLEHVVKGFDVMAVRA